MSAVVPSDIPGRARYHARLSAACHGPFWVAILWFGGCDRWPLAGFRGNFVARLARFGKANGDGLLSRRYDPAFSALAGTKRAALFSTHGARDALARGRTIFPFRAFFLWHGIPPAS